MLGVARVQFHHYAILVEAVVERGDLALAEGVAQHRGDGAHVHAQPCGGVAVDVQRHLARAFVAGGLHIDQFRQQRQRIGHARGPAAQQVQFAGHQLERIVAVASATPAADAQVLVDPQPQPAAGDFRGLRADPVDHLLAGNAAFGQWLDLDHDEGVVDARAAADVADDVLDRRIVHQHLAVDIQFGLHHLEREAVVAARKTAQLAGVLLRHHALGHDHEQPDVEADHQCEQRQQQRAMLQRGRQAARITGPQPREEAPAGLLHTVRWWQILAEPQQACAQARGQAQRYRQRYEHRRHQRHRELAEQAFDEIVQEQDRHEHHCQRQVHRQQRGADLARAAQGGG